jgi:hypothetical protein
MKTSKAFDHQEENHQQHNKKGRGVRFTKGGTKGEE